MSDWPQIPNAETSPALHEFLVQLRDTAKEKEEERDKELEDLKSRVTATEEAQEETEEEYPIGTIMMLVANSKDASGITYGPTGELELTYTGDKLSTFVLSGFGGDATVDAYTLFRDSQSLPDEQVWRSLGTPTVDTTILGHQFQQRVAMNFKRIS